MAIGRRRVSAKRAEYPQHRSRHGAQSRQQGGAEPAGGAVEGIETKNVVHRTARQTTPGQVTIDGGKAKADRWRTCTVEAAPLETRNRRPQGGGRFV